MSIVDSVVKANEFQRSVMVRKIEAGLSTLEGRVIAVLGLAFKQGTDDVRESSVHPDHPGDHRQGRRGQGVRSPSHDERQEPPPGSPRGRQAPATTKPPKAISGTGPYQIMYGVDEYDVARGADALVILTEWNQFRHLDLARIAAAMRGRHFFDFRNIYEPDDVAKFGFIYEAVGRPVSAGRA
ncbi:MAG: hypothetical protein MZU79_06040 [Anaerotruncus sp.]|nr:hypothetical protein [Anaerotruncus sp.]